MTEKLTHNQKELLLAFVANHMDLDLRRKVMIELPDAYNRWMGRTIISSQVIDYRQPLIQRNEKDTANDGSGSDRATDDAHVL